MLFRSIILFGTIEMDLDEEERRKALGLILEKYCAGHEVVGMRYMEGSFHRTNVLKMVVSHKSGKRK